MKFVGPWTVHDVHWLAEKSLKSQNLRLLFIKQYINSNRKPKKRVKKKKKKREKNANALESAQSKRSFSVKQKYKIAYNIYETCA